MPSEPIHADLISRLRSAEGHVRGIIGMVESGAVCQDVVQQVQAVQGALREVNRLLVHHHLQNCLRAALADPDPAVREHAIADVLTLYRLAGGDAPLWSGKELL